MTESFVYDFDAQFQKYLNNWLREHRDEYTTEDKLEDALVDVYDQWLVRPAKWLNGEKPGEYFYQFPAEDLIRTLERYVNVGVSVPNVLLDAVSEKGMESEAGLLRFIEGEFSILKKSDAQKEARLLAIQLLNEIGSEKPMRSYIRFILNHSDQEECESMAEALTAMGETAHAPILDAFAEEPDADAASWFLSVLVELENDPRVLDLLLDAFRNDAQRRAIYASFLSKYGSSKAIAPIKEVMIRENLNYLEWIECRNAVEALGGIVNFEMPDFSGDAYYESLKNME